jgi:hypothetical protein
MIYGIFRPESELPLGLMESFFPPTVDEMADHLAGQWFFRDRDDFLKANPHIRLAAMLMH